MKVRFFMFQVQSRINVKFKRKSGILANWTLYTVIFTPLHSIECSMKTVFRVWVLEQPEWAKNHAFCHLTMNTIAKHGRCEGNFTQSSRGPKCGFSSRDLVIRSVPHIGGEGRRHHRPFGTFMFMFMIHLVLPGDCWV